MPHTESHTTQRVGWLRALVLGANDGIVSTASLIVGVAASSAGRSQVLVAGVAGLVGGAMSMAAGEYVSVSSQADAERADLGRERQELASDPERELRELAQIYEARGLDPALADAVARGLTQRDELDAHAREELGISASTTAKPVQAALTSALSFSLGASLPLASAALTSGTTQIVVVTVTALVALAALGAVGAVAGGSPIKRATLRVTFWGALAMAITALIGRLVGTVV